MSSLDDFIAAMPEAKTPFDTHAWRIAVLLSHIDGVLAGGAPGAADADALRDRARELVKYAAAINRLYPKIIVELIKHGFLLDGTKTGWLPWGAHEEIAASISNPGTKVGKEIDREINRHRRPVGECRQWLVGSLNGNDQLLPLIGDEANRL